jgi:hypothetical protein
MEDKKQQSLIVIQDGLPQEAIDFNRSIMDFVKSLNQPPSKDELKKLDLGYGKGEVDYVPIEIIEDKLDYFFSGLWQTRNFKYQVIVNELVGDLELGIWHPVLKEWIWRSGSAAAQIKLRAEYEIDQNGQPIKDSRGYKVKKQNSPLDVERKIMNTLREDAPTLKTECIKNAAKSFGRTFGRSLGRKTEERTNFLDNIQDIQGILNSMGNISDMTELVSFLNSLPKVQQNDKRIQKLFSAKRSKLKSDENS